MWKKDDVLLSSGNSSGSFIGGLGAPSPWFWSGVNAGGLIEGQREDSLGFYYVSKFVKIVRTSDETVL